MSNPFKLQRVATRLPDDGKSNLSEVLQAQFTFASTGNALTIAIPASPEEPVLLHNVVLAIITGFGAGKTVNVGDGTDPDAYVDETDLDENVVGASAQSVGGANAKAMGELLISNRVITVTLGGTPTVGEAYLLAFITRL